MRLTAEKVEAALTASNGDRAVAAAQLGVTRAGIDYWVGKVPKLRALCRGLKPKDQHLTMAERERERGRVVKELARVGFSDIRRIFEGRRLKNIDELDDDTAAMVSSVEVVTRNLGDGEVEYVHRIRLWDKNSALEKLAKYLGLYAEAEEKAAANNVTVVDARQVNVTIGPEAQALLDEVRRRLAEE